jgi:hypothetical protein
MKRVVPKIHAIVPTAAKTIRTIMKIANGSILYLAVSADK